MMNEAGIRRFANHAVRGYEAIYFTGDLAYEREFEKKKHKNGQWPLNHLADLVYSLYKDDKLITLIQRRLGPSQWNYVAVKL